MIEQAKQYLTQLIEEVETKYSRPRIEADEKYIDVVAGESIRHGEVFSATWVGASTGLNIHRDGVNQAVNGIRDRNAKDFGRGVRDGCLYPIPFLLIGGAFTGYLAARNKSRITASSIGEKATNLADKISSRSSPPNS